MIRAKIYILSLDFDDTFKKPTTNTKDSSLVFRTCPAFRKHYTLFLRCKEKVLKYVDYLLLMKSS